MTNICKGKVLKIIRKMRWRTKKYSMRKDIHSINKIELRAIICTLDELLEKIKEEIR